MSKERLEEIAYNVGVSIDGEKALMSSDDYDFLYNYALDQAEQVEELEKDIKEWEIVNECWEEINTNLAEQNKRYREALEEILAEAYEEAGVHPDTGMQLETFIAKTARQALEGEK